MTTPQIGRILFATDLSANSWHAFGYAVSLAKATGASIHMLHVVEPLSDDAKLTLMMFVQDEKARFEAYSKRLEAAKTLLAERQDKYWAEVDDDDRALRAKVEAIDVVEGFPAEMILRRAKDADLVVLGSHEHGFSHTFLGSVAKRVLRRSTTPTLIAPRAGEG